MAWFAIAEKDPDAKLDYSIDWEPWPFALGDTITTSTWEVFEANGITPTVDMTVESDSQTTTTTTVWLSGGTHATKYVATNHIVTAQGREDDRSILIKCKER